MLHILELAIIAGNLRVRPGVMGEIASCLGAAHGLEKLSSRRRRGGEDVVLAAAPVRGHLAATGGRIGGGADRLQELSGRADAQGEAEGAVAIVREKPVVAGAQVHCRSHQQGFMPGTGDLKVDFLLALEQDLAIVDPPRKNHQPVDIQQLLRGKAFVRLFRHCCWHALHNFRRHSRFLRSRCRRLRRDAD